MNIRDVAEKAGEYLLEPLTNPYYWLSVLAALVVTFTIDAVTGSELIGMAAGFVAILLTPSDKAGKEWRQERKLRRWAEETACWIREQGDEASVEYDRYGHPTIFVTLSPVIRRIEISGEVTL